MKLNNKFAIGCLVQWYEIEIFEEYFESIVKSLQNIENKKNVIVDVYVNMALNLEKIEESDTDIQEIFQRFIKIRKDMSYYHINSKFNFYPVDIRKINDKSLSSVILLSSSL